MKKNRPKKTPVVVSVRNVTKTYVLHHQKPTFSGQVLRRERNELFTALKDFSLDIHKGEKIGIIGKNGSGKSTLLKIIAGITAPTNGSVTTHGKIVSLINLAAGFHSDLTGEENIYLNAMLLGMSRAETRKKLQNIIEFADIHQFIDAPFFTYSDGMKLRLGFAIAVHVEPEILILDESSIMAGDQFFQRKMVKKMNQFFRAGKTIIVVTHWLEFLHKHCERIIWMEAGKIKETGGTQLLNAYVGQ